MPHSESSSSSSPTAAIDVFPTSTIRRRQEKTSPTSFPPTSLPLRRPCRRQMLASTPHVHTLAFEVLGLVFEAVVDFPSDRIDPRAWPEQKGMHIPYAWSNDLAPLTLSKVCRKWRQVCLHTPKLWRFIRVNTSSTKRTQLDRILAYIERSGAVGLEVLYDAFGGGYTGRPIGQNLFDLLRTSARRWTSFQARYMGPLHLHHIAALLEETRELETLFLTQLPLDGLPYIGLSPNMGDGQVRPFLSIEGGLRSWSFGNLRQFGYNDLEQSSATSAEELGHLLRSAPRLEKMWFSSVDRSLLRHAERTEDDRRSLISLPHLTHLHIHPSAMMNSMTPELLDMLELPALNSLNVNLLDYLPLPESIDLLANFLCAHAKAVTQSRAATIQHLTMVAARGDSEVLTIMAMLPDVEHVVIWGSVLEGTAQLCKAFGEVVEFPEYLQMNPYLDDDWEFDEMLRMEEEERNRMSGAITNRVHDAATCLECEELMQGEEESIHRTMHVTLDTSSCILSSQPMVDQMEEQGRPSLFERGIEEVKVVDSVPERVVHQPNPSTNPTQGRPREVEEKKGQEISDESGMEGPSFIPGLPSSSSSRLPAISSYRSHLANGTMFTSWLLPNLRSIHFRTTKFYRGENTLLLLRMLRQRQDAARGLYTVHRGGEGERRTMTTVRPVELESVCLKDIRLCRICRPRFQRMRNELGVGWDKGIARTLCTYVKGELGELKFDVDVFFEECHTAWDITNRTTPCGICP